MRGREGIDFAMGVGVRILSFSVALLIGYCQTGAVIYVFIYLFIYLFICLLKFNYADNQNKLKYRIRYIYKKE